MLTLPPSLLQVVVPAELGYPANDPKHDRVGPKPTTFSGQRALDFVLTNQGLVDKTVSDLNLICIHEFF